MSLASFATALGLLLGIKSFETGNSTIKPPFNHTTVESKNVTSKSQTEKPKPGKLEERSKPMKSAKSFENQKI